MIGRTAYGLAFVAGVPLAAVAWARALEPRLALPVVHGPWIGGGAAAAGALLMVWAWATMARSAGGLPMNAYPPPRFTRRGPYGALNDPIYVGAVLLAAGVSVAAGSAAGLWIVTPVLALACAALVQGHERRDLARRFGDLPAPRLRLAPDAGRTPTAGERLWVWTHLLLPWLVLYEAIGHLPVPGAFEVWLPFERGVPAHPLAELPYASVYLAVLAAPLLASRADELRRLVRVGQVGCLVGFLVYLTVPAIAPPRPIAGGGPLAELLALERADGLAGRAALPSFHVFWTLWAAAALRPRAPRPRARWFVGAWAALAIAACWLTGMHALADLAAGALLFVLARSSPALWRAAVRATERLANGWREWRVGPVRFINHGLFAGAASLAGALLTLTLMPAGSGLAMALVALASLVGAGLWGQALVGSRTLLRPYGYFGSLLGLLLSFGVLAVLGHDLWALAAAVATAAPLTQAIGRLRCMVQGCCHGAPCAAEHGIRVTHPRSRVVFVSHLEGQPILPTPLLSIAGNAIILPLLLRLWWIEAPAALVLGGYLVLQGLARFVEEGHRGEVQTQLVGPFRIYQVLAAAMVLVGILVTSLPSPALTWAPAIGGADVLVAVVIGALHVFAMGVDFPESNRRFSRLV